MTSKLIFLFTISFFFVVSSQHQFETSTNHHNSSPFSFIKPLIGCQKGNTVEGINILKKYLHRFGYLTYTPNQVQANKDDDDNISKDDYFDDVTEAAVKAYQLNHGLVPTGIIDNETLATISTPRCGVPDHTKGEISKNLTNKKYCHGAICIHFGSDYAYFDPPYTWPPSKSHLTYAFPSGFPPQAVNPISRSFDRWASVSHFTFSNSGDYANADIKISFQRGDHGDGNAFDGHGGVLAHAFAPTDGRLHFDADDTWSAGPVSGAAEVGTVGLHEIGHILGLQHSTFQDAIMYPIIPLGATKDLSQDDIQGIKTLYNDP